MHTHARLCIEAHNKTNHFYDEELGVGYPLHLKLVNLAFQEFSYLLDNTKDYYTGQLVEFMDNGVTLREACDRASWGHDLIEDARLTYNDVKRMLGQEAADICLGVTNFPGKTRKERTPPAYYQRLMSTLGSRPIKLADRIANVRFSKLMRSSQFEMYKKENADFMASLGYVPGEIDELQPMFDCLIKLFHENSR
jgi:hypothetical protein